MRLSVFNIKDLDMEKYHASLNRVLDGYELKTGEGRSSYVAVYNGSILGIASADRGVIDYFSVLEITRNRGVGGFLLKTVANNLIEEYGSATISQVLYSLPDFKLFTEHMGFENAVLTRPIEKEC
jgi:hypothetical protein